MKTKIPIEDVQIGDIINGKEVVDVLHRLHANYVRVVLKGGAIVDGYMGKKWKWSGSHLSSPAKSGSSNRFAAQSQQRREVVIMAKLTRLGKMVKRHCLERGITQTELARKLGMSKIYLSKIMYGYRPPGKYTEALARELGIDPEAVRALAA